MKKQESEVRPETEPTATEPAAVKRRSKEGYTRVTVNVRDDNYAKLKAAADVEWADVNKFLSRQVEKNFATLIPQLELKME